MNEVKRIEEKTRLQQKKKTLKNFEKICCTTKKIQRILNSKLFSKKSYHIGQGSIVKINLSKYFVQKFEKNDSIAIQRNPSQMPAPVFQII